MTCRYKFLNEKLLINISLLFLFLFGFSYQVFGAEVLQIRSASVLLIGDHNRTYTVKIACAEVSTDLEENAINWLRNQLPRYTKVNLRPKGSLDGILVAKVIPIKTGIDITESYLNNGFIEEKC